MNTSNKPKTMTDTDNHRSYFDWGRNMQVVRNGNREVAMTESELTRFFGVNVEKTQSQASNDSEIFQPASR